MSKQHVDNLWEVPQLSCRQGNTVSRVCLNPECRLALICDNPGCHSCGRGIHKFCYSTALDQFTALVNQPLISFGGFVGSLTEIEEVLMQKIRDNREEVVRRHPFGRLQERYQQTLSEVFSGKEPEAMSGRQADEIYRKSKEDCLREEEQASGLVESYRFIIEDTAEQLLKVREMVCQQYIEGVANASRLLKLGEQQREQQEKSLKEALGGSGVMEQLAKREGRLG